MSDDFVTSREGEKLLGVTRQTFFYYVNKDRIRKLPSEKRGGTLYHRGDILRLRAELGIVGDAEHIAVDWVKTTDLPNTLALDIQVYDEPVIGDMSLYFSWLKRNPHLTLAAFDADNRNRVLAYINLLPMREETILAILRKERDEKEIGPDDIEGYDRDGDYTLLAESAVTLPGHREYIGQLMQELAEYWCTQWPKLKLKRIYAQAISDDGLYLVQKMFFAPMYGYPEDAFVLDVQRKNPSRFVQSFQRCISEKEK